VLLWPPNFRGRSASVERHDSEIIANFRLPLSLGERSNDLVAAVGAKFLRERAGVLTFGGRYDS